MSLFCSDPPTIRLLIEALMLAFAYVPSIAGLPSASTRDIENCVILGALHDKTDIEPEYVLLYPLLSVTVYVYDTEPSPDKIE